GAVRTASCGFDVRVRRADIRIASEDGAPPGAPLPSFCEGEKSEVRRARAVKNRADQARPWLCASVDERPSSAGSLVPIGAQNGRIPPGTVACPTYGLRATVRVLLNPNRNQYVSID